MEKLVQILKSKKFIVSAIVTTLVAASVAGAVVIKKNETPELESGE